MCSGPGQITPKRRAEQPQRKNRQWYAGVNLWWEAVFRYRTVIAKASAV